MFPKVIFNNKENPGITKGISKSSKFKQKIYEKSLKIRSIHNDKIYKDYRKLFETITIKSKRKYYTKKLGDAKKAITSYERSESKVICYTLTYKVVINKNGIFVEKGIVSPFNNFFINIYPKLADDIPTAVKSLESYFQKTNEKGRINQLLRN